MASQRLEARAGTARRALPLLALGLALGGLVAWGRGREPPRHDLRWVALDERSGLAAALLPLRVAALGEGPGGRADLFLAWARVGPGGRPIATSRVIDVSRSPAVAETRLAVAPGRVAVLSEARAGAPASVEVYLLDEACRASRSWSRAEAVAGAAASLQLWGQPSAPRRIGLRLPEGVRDAALAFRSGRLVVEWEGGSAEVDLERPALLRGDGRVAVAERVEGRPDPFRLAVDQLRHGRLVGPERLQRLEGLYLALSDSLAALSGERLAAPRAPELGRELAEAPSEAGTGWPPPPLVPSIEPPLDGEGLWRARDPAFAPAPAGSPPLVLSAFVRTEPDRVHTSRVHVAIWQPSWLELHWEAGTIEPHGPDGLAGTGRVPRESVERLVAGFNGGFQAVDGAFGMRTRSGPFLPPVPYAATVAELPGGRLGLGTWPAESRAGEGLLAFRQNLSPLVEDGRVNPFGRIFWGGAARGSGGAPRTDRTGLCLTREGHLAFLWGQRVTVDGLARGMTAARCVYGMMLDINFTNTAFELYRVGPRGGLPDLGRPIDPELEAEGEVEGRPELDYRAQALAPGMTRVGFPRFVRTDLRDFFYLLVREDALAPPLPLGRGATPLSCGAGEPPCAFLVRQGEATLVVPCLDRLRATLAPPGAAPRGGDLAFPVSPARSGPRLGLAVAISRGPFGGLSVVIAEPSERLPDDGLLLAGADPSSVAPDPAVAGTIVARWPDGRAALAVTTAEAAAGLDRLLREAGAAATLFVPAGGGTLLLEPDEAPMARRIFADTEPVPPGVWQPLARRAQERADALGLTRHYVQARHYHERDSGRRRERRGGVTR